MPSPRRQRLLPAMVSRVALAIVFPVRWLAYAQTYTPDAMGGPAAIHFFGSTNASDAVVGQAEELVTISSPAR